MRGVFAFFFCLAFCAAMAHREPSDFGDVNHADFEPGPFPDASSVVLFDVASMYYEVYQGEVFPQFTRHLRVRINTREGFAKWGNFVLGHRYLKVNRIRAATYTVENGKVVARELAKDQIIKDRRNTNERIFSLPNVIEGCVIEISYSGSYTLSISPNWVVQSDVPVLWSEYILRTSAHQCDLWRNQAGHF